MKKSLFLASAAVLALTAGVVNAGTLDDVKGKGKIKCGVSQGLPGFSAADEAGVYSGLDVDFCRAVAAATIGDAQAVEFTPLSAEDRFTALSSGEVDILSRNTTMTMSRDTSMGLSFVGVTYYDGQGMMVPASLGVKSALELDGAVICTNTGTTTELNITDYFNLNGMKFELVAIENSDEVVAAYDSGRCNVFTTDRSGLAAERLKLADPEAHTVLPEIISKEPLGPVVRNSDDQWLKINKWVLASLLEAEELGITQANVDEMLTSPNPAIQRILGVGENDFGTAMGLPANWAYQAIKAVGNYGEMYDRNVGPATPLKLERGVNALWSKGGFQYSAPIR